MIDSIVGLFYSLRINGAIAIWLYWLPLMLCLYGYIRRTFSDVKKDVELRANAEVLVEPNRFQSYYYPSVTIGTIIGRIIVTALPVANLWAAMFDISPWLFKKLFEFCSNVLDQPLVPKKKKD